MDNDHFEKAKKLVIIGLASDDVLLEQLVLKGGNAIAIGHDLNDRGSKDIDYSIEGEFGQELEEMKIRMETVLKATFEEEGYYLFDFNLEEKPTNLRENLKKWWGGYKIYFKIIQKDGYDRYKDSIEDLRRFAIQLQENNSPRFEVEISKYEFVKRKEVELDGFIIYVYPLELIVAEKLRAICQQFPKYQLEIIKNKTVTTSPRPRDFYDVYSIMEFNGEEVNVQSEEFKNLVAEVFKTKHVPFSWLAEIKEYREFHKTEYASLKSTVTVKIEEFDFYFDYVLDQVVRELL